MNPKDTVVLHDKTFRIAIPYATISRSIDEVAEKINRDYGDKPTPLFLGVLNGSFMFMAELLQRIEFNCEVSFIKIASYDGTNSSGNVSELIGLTSEIRGRHVILVEDIVDTGTSIEHLTHTLSEHAPASVAIVTLLFKADAYKKNIPIDYPALSIADRFIVGFGLDYNQLGRNLKNIYELSE